MDVSDPDTEGQRNTAADNGDEKFSPFIRFTQFDDWSVSIRDNGPDVMIDDEGNTLAVNMRWSNYSNNDKMEPAQQLARRAGANMAIDLDVFDMVNSDMVSEGGNREFNGKGVMIAVEDTEVVKRNPAYTKESRTSTSASGTWTRSSGFLSRCWKTTTSARAPSTRWRTAR